MALIKRNLSYTRGEPSGNRVRIIVRQYTNDSLLDTIVLDITPQDVTKDVLYENFKDKSWFSVNTKFNITLESITFVQSDGFIKQIANSLNEFVIGFEENYELVFDFLTKHSKESKPVTVSINEYETFVNNFGTYETNDLKIIVENSFTNRPVDIGDVVDFFVIDSTLEADYTFTETREPRFIEFLTRHRKDWEGLSISPSNSKIKKTYREVSNSFLESKQSDVFNWFDRKINIDYSSFDNHVKYGSAVSKTINVIDKINSVIALGSIINITDWSLGETAVTIFDNEWFDKLSTYGNANTNKQTIKTLIDTLKGMTPFERWIFSEKYVKDNVNYDSYMEQLRLDADEFDIKNLNFILYLVPDQLVINDFNSTMSTLLILMGEYFDIIHFSISAMDNIKNYDLYSNNFIDKNTVTEALNKFGIFDILNFDGFTMEDYIKNDDNLKKISNEISIRLLNNLPLLLKSKGTLDSVRYLLNVYGISPELVSVFEGGYQADSDYYREAFLREKDWYYLNDENTSLTVNINSSSVDLNNFTTETVVSGFLPNSSGSILSLGNRYNIYYETKPDNKIVFSFDYNGITSQITQSTYTPQTDWFFIGLTKDDTDGTFYVAQNREDGLGIEVISQESVTYLSSEYDGLVRYYTFDDISSIGAVRKDYSNSNMPMTATTNSTTGSIGKTGYGIYVETSNNDGRNIPNDGILFDIDTPFIISGWFNIPSYPIGGNSVLLGRGGTTGGYGIYVTEGGQLGCGIRNNSSNTFNLTSSLSVNTWFHALMSFDPNTLILKGYYNGVLINQTAVNNSSFVGTTTTTGIITNRAISGTSASKTSGSADNIRFYNRALVSDEEAVRIMNSDGEMPFNNITLLSQSANKITEFRVFNDTLSQRELLAHASDYRSIAEENTSTLLARFKFVKTDGDLVSTNDPSFICVPSPSGAFVSSSFKIAQFEYVDYVTSIATDVATDKVKIVERTVPTNEQLSSKKRVTINTTPDTVDNGVFNVVVSPVDYFDKSIIRNVGSFINLLPNDYDTSNYSFDVFESNKNLISEIYQSNYGIDVYKKVFNVINNNVFSKLKTVTPASSDKISGLVVKNSILKRNKDKNSKFTTSVNNGYTTPIDNIVTTPNGSTKKASASLVTNISSINNGTSSKKMAQIIEGSSNNMLVGNISNYLSKQVISKQKKINTVYLYNMGKGIESKREISPWTKNLFRGYQIIQGLGTQVDTIENAGAIIIVT